METITKDGKDDYAFLDLLQCPGFVVNTDKTVIYANEALAKLVGKRKEQTLGSPIDSLIRADDSGVNGVLATGDKARVLVWATIKEKKCFLECECTPLLDGKGSIIGVLETVRDLTAQKLAMQTVKDLIDRANAGELSTRSDLKADGDYGLLIDGINQMLEKMQVKVRWHESILDAIPFPISVTDNEMRWTFINKAVEEFLNINRRDVIGQQCNNWNANICRTDDCGFVCLKNGKNQTFFEQSGVNFQVDCAYLTDSEGAKIGNIEVVQDINAIVHADNYMHVEVARMSNNLEKLSMGLVDLDNNVGEGDQYTVQEKDSSEKITKYTAKARDAIEALVNDVSALSQAAVDGKLATRADAARHGGAFRKIVEGVNATLDAMLLPINEAAACLREMASGNLDVEMKGDYQGDHAVIKENLNATLGALNEILSQVALAAEQIAAGARQVSDSGQSLSQASTEAAASLEEITASMHEITSQTSMNAENANQANKLANQAKISAEKGEGQMTTMVRAMNDINESAASVSKIIKAIDEIAFQTNLLALNAAVEAARAGKHGKGFTVVAEEVRNLAQRSAAAAKETAEMIEGSIRKTEVGAKIAEETSKALEEIVAGSTKVTDLIGEIACASKEQSQGIGQINQGLSQVDQVTQQVTASSEESASASETLSSQSQQLKQMLARFQLKKQSFGLTVGGLPEGITPEMLQMLRSMMLSR